MIVVCPTCREKLPADEEDSCIGPVPAHGDCSGAGRVGFVHQYDPDEPLPPDYQPPKSDPRYRKGR
jgi:hypothetical protein